MPIYEYTCPGSKPEESHIFEKILPASECEKPQECPDHHVICPAIEFSSGTWVWGMNEVHWSAGTGSNPMGMNHAKRPGK